MSSPPPSGSGSGIRRPGSTERRSTFDMTKTSSASGMVDKDKEADLHRLMEKAQHGNVDAERAVSPALHAKEKREREASVGRGRSERESKGSETEVVEVPRAAEGDTEELEEVTEEEEEETIDEEEENEDEEEGKSFLRCESLLSCGDSPQGLALQITTKRMILKKMRKKKNQIEVEMKMMRTTMTTRKNLRKNERLVKVLQ